MKIRVGAKMFHADKRADGQTDMTKLIVDFRNFAIALQRLYVASIPEIVLS